MAYRPEAVGDQFGLKAKHGVKNKKDMENINAAYDEWDKVYGIYPILFEVYILLDGNKPGDWSFGPIELSHKPFYVGCGKLGRHEHSMGKGRQLERHCEKTDRIIEIFRLGGLTAVGYYIVNYFMTKEKAVVVEKKIMRLIGKRYLTNAEFNYCIIPLLEEDYMKPGDINHNSGPSLSM